MTVRRSAATSATKLLSSVGVAADATSSLFTTAGEAVRVAEIKATNWRKATEIHSAADLQIKVADRMLDINARLEDPKFKAAYEQAAQLIKSVSA